MRSRWDFSIVPRLRELVRRGSFPLLHAHTPRSALVARLAATWARVPFVYHVHSPTQRDSTARYRNLLNSAAERVSLWGNCPLIAVSSSLGEHMHACGYPRRRISVVPNGVPSARVLRGDHLPGKVWRVGVVALFRPRKGMEVLVDALAVLREQGLRVELRAIGPFESPDYEAAIIKRAERQRVDQQIVWKGFCSDVATEFTELDLLVLPSLFGEGLPMVVLEAMAAGVPVVASRVEGVPEALEDGVQGLLVNPGDAADLASAIARLVRGQWDWSILRRNAIQRHAAHFSARRMAAGVAQVYRQVLRLPNRRAASV
jgi:glycosyltransferase involved in cell wall biosynthesis